MWACGWLHPSVTDRPISIAMTMLYYTMIYCTVTIQYNTIQYNTTQSNPIQSNPIQYDPRRPTVDFRNLIVFFGPRPWLIEIRHRVKKTSTMNLFGFETLKLKIRRLKLWKPTAVGRVLGGAARAVGGALGGTTCLLLLLLVVVVVVVVCMTHCLLCYY